MHLGAIDVTLHSSRQVLQSAAGAIDGGQAGGRFGVLAPWSPPECAQSLAAAAEQVITRIGHVPAPLTQDEVGPRLVADLSIYVRQHHAERDDAALGRCVLAGDRPG